ncbi:dimethylarginine dimethylaminohydrolase family protein [Nonomuraea typhae]|uniref:dimethylarginine dimethylaminohydrolase family protein n=1 Tax=Nonomuraea typhae TaxID=2603600 RepID=UPI0012F99FE8|nr:arginine deiminase family protein [Nonomuraea typhae]
MIDISVTSDVGLLRDVILAPHKAFTLEELILEAEADGARGDEALLGELMARYSIEAPDPAVAAGQHAQLVRVLEEHDVTVRWADPVDCVVQLYPRDMGFAIDDVFFLARPATPTRRREQAELLSLQARMSKVRALDAGHIEGGDVLVTSSEVLVGVGDSTDEEGIEALRRGIAAAGLSREVVPMRFTHLGVVHLDVHFTLASPEVGLISPAAFDAESLDYLKGRFELIEVTPEEVRALAVNTVALGPDRLVIQAGHERLEGELRRRGITPVPVDFSEITRFPGGLHCATLPLIRE